MTIILVTVAEVNHLKILLMNKLVIKEETQIQALTIKNIWKNNILKKEKLKVQLVEVLVQHTLNIKNLQLPLNLNNNKEFSIMINPKELLI